MGGPWPAFGGSMAECAQSIKGHWKPHALNSAAVDGKRAAAAAAFIGQSVIRHQDMSNPVKPRSANLFDRRRKLNGATPVHGPISVDSLGCDTQFLGRFDVRGRASSPPSFPSPSPCTQKGGETHSRYKQTYKRRPDPTQPNATAPALHTSGVYGQYGHDRRARHRREHHAAL